MKPKTLLERMVRAQPATVIVFSANAEGSAKICFISVRFILYRPFFYMTQHELVTLDYMLCNTGLCVLQDAGTQQGIL